MERLGSISEYTQGGEVLSQVLSHGKHVYMKGLFHGIYT